MSDISSCPKCGCDMVQGFVLEHWLLASTIDEWREGQPKATFGGIQCDSSKSFPIGVFRCSGCGYLECYARDEFAPATKGRVKASQM